MCLSRANSVLLVKTTLPYFDGLNPSPLLIAIIEGDSKSRKVVTEEKAYVDPAQARILEMMNYKPKS